MLHLEAVMQSWEGFVTKNMTAVWRPYSEVVDAQRAPRKWMTDGVQKVQVSQTVIVSGQ